MIHDEPLGRRFSRLRPTSEQYGISVSTLRRMIRDERLTGYRPTGAANSPILVDLDELEALIASTAAARVPSTRAIAEACVADSDGEQA